MAKIETVHLVDDLDGGEAAETVGFALAGTSYVIDLSELNAAKLRDVLAPYVAAARRAGATGRSSSGRPAPVQDRKLNQTIRAWAVANGWPIAERGRIPAQVLDAYYRQDGLKAVS